jgi:hypothetical protein
VQLEPAQRRTGDSDGLAAVQCRAVLDQGDGALSSPSQSSPLRVSRLLSGSVVFSPSLSSPLRVSRLLSESVVSYPSQSSPLRVSRLLSESVVSSPSQSSGSPPSLLGRSGCRAPLFPCRSDLQVRVAATFESKSQAALQGSTLQPGTGRSSEPAGPGRASDSTHGLCVVTDGAAYRLSTASVARSRARCVRAREGRAGQTRRDVGRGVGADRLMRSEQRGPGWACSD